MTSNICIIFIYNMKTIENKYMTSNISYLLLGKTFLLSVRQNYLLNLGTPSHIYFCHVRSNILKLSTVTKLVMLQFLCDCVIFDYF